jgi:hypothetical protein
MPLAIQTHSTHVARLAEDLRGATALLLSRDRAIEAAIHRDRARLALPLLQPGLFDRRSARSARAQERMADAALAAIAERLGVPR